MGFIIKLLVRHSKLSISRNFNSSKKQKMSNYVYLAFAKFLLIFTLSPLTAQPQIDKIEKWLNSGSFCNWYSSIGEEREEDGPIREQQAGWQWPAYYLNQDMQVAKGLWIGCKDYYEPEIDSTFEFKVVHCGPRPRMGWTDEFFPVEFKHYAKYQPTEVRVDGTPSHYPNQETKTDEIKVNLPYDQMIYNFVNTQIGMSMKRKIYQFSNKYYDNVHIIEYTFINTGNIDFDSEIEKTSGIIKDAYFYFQTRIAVGKEVRILFGDPTAWGRNTLNNEVGPYSAGGNDDLRYSYAWHGYFDDFNKWNNVGGPILEPDVGFGARIDRADTVGRLGAAQFAGTLTLFAQSGSNSDIDDPNQPSTTGYESSDNPLNYESNPFDIQQMRERYNLMIKGHPVKSHADSVTGGDYVNSTSVGGDSSVWRAGYSYVNGYGPYTVAYGDSVKIIRVEGASGLSRDECIRIGKLFKNGEISVAEKNSLVLTGADSLKQTFERITNAFQSNWNIPRAPHPPKAFSIHSGEGVIHLEWTVFDDGPEIMAFEIYRTTNDAVNGYASNQWYSKYELIAELKGHQREFTDTTTNQDKPYYYYILSVGNEVQTNPGLNIPTHKLKSNRSYTQTYIPAFLQIVSVDDEFIIPTEFKLEQNFPNPFNPITTIRYTIARNGIVRLRIFDMLGQEVELLISEEKDPGNYMIKFDASSLSSGAYFYSLQSGDFIETKKLIVLK